MPIFEFICDKCGKDFEEITTGGDISPLCPHCGSAETHKLISRCARYKKAGGAGYSGYSAPQSKCAGCSGGSCATCGH